MNDRSALWIHAGTAPRTVNYTRETVMMTIRLPMKNRRHGKRRVDHRMTRFLSRVLDDPRCGSFNEETERLFAYHHATKHTYHSVRSNAHFLDWSNQPDPFRTYEGAPAVSRFRLNPASRAREHSPRWRRSRKHDKILGENNPASSNKFSWT